MIHCVITILLFTSANANYLARKTDGQDCVSALLNRGSPYDGPPLSGFKEIDIMVCDARENATHCYYGAPQKGCYGTTSTGTEPAAYTLDTNPTSLNYDELKSRSHVVQLFYAIKAYSHGQKHELIKILTTKIPTFPTTQRLRYTTLPPPTTSVLTTRMSTRLTTAVRAALSTLPPQADCCISQPAPTVYRTRRELQVSTTSTSTTTAPTTVTPQNLTAGQIISMITGTAQLRLDLAMNVIMPGSNTASTVISLIVVTIPFLTALLSVFTIAYPKIRNVMDTMVMDLAMALYPDTSYYTSVIRKYKTLPPFRPTPLLTTVRTARCGGSNPSRNMSTIMLGGLATFDTERVYMMPTFVEIIVGFHHGDIPLRTCNNTYNITMELTDLTFERVDEETFSCKPLYKEFQRFLASAYGANLAAANMEIFPPVFSAYIRSISSEIKSFKLKIIAVMFVGADGIVKITFRPAISDGFHTTMSLAIFDEASSWQAVKRPERQLALDIEAAIKARPPMTEFHKIGTAVEVPAISTKALKTATMPSVVTTETSDE